MPPVTDREARVQALEEQMNKLLTGVAPLSIEQLSRKLDQRAAPRSIDLDRLPYRLSFGQSSATFPGAASLATQKRVPHTLDTIPTIVVATAQAFSQGAVIAAHAGDYTKTDFAVQIEFVNGFAPAAATSFPFVWLAIAL